MVPLVFKDDKEEKAFEESVRIAGAECRERLGAVDSTVKKWPKPTADEAPPNVGFWDWLF